jgi:tight adherence protein B
MSCARLLESVARAVRSGMSLSAALDRALEDNSLDQGIESEMNSRIHEALRRHHHGEPLAVSLGIAKATCRDDVVRLTLAVLGLAAGHGGPSAEALDRAGAALRERASLAADARTQAAPARLSSTMLTLSPVAFSALTASLDDNIRRTLVATPLGWGCMITGLLLAGLGRHWMTRLVLAAS